MNTSKGTKVKIDNIDFYALPEYGSYVAVLNDCLLDCPMSPNGEYDEDEVCDVSAPESQDYLDAVNAMFGTNFRYEEFAGR